MVDGQNMVQCGVNLLQFNQRSGYAKLQVSVNKYSTEHQQKCTKKETVKFKNKHCTSKQL